MYSYEVNLSSTFLEPYCKTVNAAVSQRAKVDEGMSESQNMTVEDTIRQSFGAGGLKLKC